ncbi:cGMP-dependent 3',5'-cGMP phosphodiesterase A [Hondaea fermentalgiana]|uniref:cGMP-dependent 3',5'-cGMP phosphodiesterase A n=1 Tax=Hondaea fermentalgiana TaxID=2315210 RepID=A0A2R5GV78_9STRA|nr:cGMP-dependent 3',5'-cGMP phosphodiesterase A [Hondaea fermentalgiana]|eukprot:GBG31824.1 cGMP-dependent 3',5'-cGMP phosphodiesterase A [Hondaea fermentalgiana]
MGAGKGNDSAAVRRKSSTASNKLHKKQREKGAEDAAAGAAAEVEEELEALRARNAELEEQLREAEAEVDLIWGQQLEARERERGQSRSLSRSSASSRARETPAAAKERSGSVAVSVPFTPKVTAEPLQTVVTPVRERVASSQDPHEVLRIGVPDPPVVERRPSVSAHNVRGPMAGRASVFDDDSTSLRVPSAHMRVQSRTNSTLRQQLADLLDRQQEEVPLPLVGRGPKVASARKPSQLLPQELTYAQQMRRRTQQARKDNNGGAGAGAGDDDDDDDDDDGDDKKHAGDRHQQQQADAKHEAVAKGASPDKVSEEREDQRRGTLKSWGLGWRTKSRPAPLVETALDSDDSDSEEEHAPALSPEVNYDSIIDGEVVEEDVDEGSDVLPYNEEGSASEESGDDDDDDDGNGRYRAKRRQKDRMVEALAKVAREDDADTDSDDSYGQSPSPAPRISRQTSSRVTSFMVNVSRLLTAYHKKTLKPSETKNQKNRRSPEHQAMQLGNLIDYLPRGGVVIRTTIGPVQFGMPPETVKDSMAMGLQVPEIYVVPRERFNMSAGVNVCELEFPAFFNFFIRKRKTTLVTHRDAWEDLLTIMTEALNGPKSEFLFAEKEYSDFCPESVRAACPDHEKEVFHFRAPNREPGQVSNIHMLDIEMLLEPKFFDTYGVCDLGNGVMIFDDEDNVRFELVDTKMQNVVSTVNDAGDSSASDDGGVLIPYRVAESCTVPISGGLVPRLDMALAGRDEVPGPGPVAGGGSREELLSHKRVKPSPLGTSLSQEALLSRKGSGVARQSVKSTLSAGDVGSRTRSHRMGMLKLAGGSARSASGRLGPGMSAAAAATLQEQHKRGSGLLQMDAAPVGTSDEETFVIPKFGLTVLGNSHGFDKDGSTSGFVLWVNGQGVMVDPPPHSTSLLFESGIPPNSITALILTHCHADHDAGTFQKMITEHKITLMTTTTIFESFKRKYAAVSGLKPEFIEQLVNFRPVFLEEPNYWNGASLRFFYSLHSIPCVGFQASFQGKDIVYSADTFYDPPAMKRMNEEGILSDERLQALLDFPWHCDVVLHEAGVPPIHTPLDALAALPEEHKRNVRLIHIDANSAARAANLGFRIAECGVENTIVLIPRSEEHQMLKFLQLLGSIEIFRHFTVNQALDLMLMAHEEFYPRDALILEKGTVDERFMIILQGRATVEYDNLRKFYRAGDYLGELAAWKQTRIIKQKSHLGMLDRSKGSFLSLVGGLAHAHVTSYSTHSMLSAGSSEDDEDSSEDADLQMARDHGEMVFIDDQIVKETVRAETDVRAMVIDKYALNYLLLNDPVLRERLESMIHARMDGSWEAISLNSRLRLLSSMQKTQLQGLLQTKHMRRGERLWRRGDSVEVAMLVARGTLIFEEVHGPVDSADLTSNTHAPLMPGMLIFDYYGCHHGRPLTTTLACYSETASIFVIDSHSMLHFLDRNPMILLALLKSPILI